MELIHGGDTESYRLKYGRVPLDFSANCNPLGVPAGVEQAIRDAAAHADGYPDPLCRELCAAIAGNRGASPQQVLCGNGAADLIYRLVLARKRAEWQYTAAFGPAGTGETADSAGRRNPMTEDGGLSDGGGATMPGGGEAEETFYLLPGRRDSGAAGMMESARALSRTVQRDARRYDGGFPLYD